MESSNVSEPPAKKRRFFSDSAAEMTLDARPSSSASETPPSHRPSKPLFEDPEVAIKSDPYAISQPPSPLNRTPLAEQPVGDATNRSHDPTAIKFDQETFESFVGDKVSTDVLDIIRENCGNDLGRAVNMYFDGTWKNFKKPTPSVSSFVSQVASRPSPVPKIESELASIPSVQTARRMRESRYIGALGVEGWATRSGTNLIKHGDVVRIERQKIQPPQAPKVKTKLGVQVAPARVSPAMAKRVDVIVRFTDTSGAEIGRLAKDTANWVSTLMDQKICRFEGVCVYAPERLRTNDTVFLQLKCWLLPSAFFDRAFTLADDRAVGLFEEKETTEEKDLRLRQVALVRLLQEVNLLPTRGNAAASKHQRQGLLAAAEMAETKEKEKKATSSSVK